MFDKGSTVILRISVLAKNLQLYRVEISISGLAVDVTGVLT